MLPAIKRNLKMYRGAEFNVRFRFRNSGIAIDPTTWNIFFTASNHQNGQAVFTLTKALNPSYFTINAGNEYLVTVTIPETETDIPHESLYYEIDIKPPASGRLRRILGMIRVIKDATL